MAEEEPKKELSCCAYIFYYLVLFFAFWFGASRFDQDGDGDFDPEDVQKYLEDKGYLSKNFSKATKERKATEKEKRKAGTKDLGSSDSNPNMALPKQKPATPEAAQKPKPKPAENTDGGGWLGTLDKDGDGEIEFEDMLGAQVEGEAVEDEMMENLMEKQKLPWFMIFECTTVMGLWLTFSLIALANGEPNAFAGKEGLDSLADGMMDLRMYGLECEDYRPQIWRWLSYQFTHVGAMHVTMNVFLNVMLGVPLEGLHGHWRMAVMFNAGVIGGAFCYFVTDAHIPVVGCSGGCYALVGIHLAALIMNWKQTKFRWPTVVFLATLVLVDVLSYFMAVSSEAASHSAHIGGALAGLLVGVVVVKNTKVESYEKYIWGCAGIIAISLTIMSIAILFTLSNDGPLTIFEAAAGDHGWCWRRQLWLHEDFNSGIYNVYCVKCGTQECIQYYNDTSIVGAMATVNKTHCANLMGLSNYTQPYY